VHSFSGSSILEQTSPGGPPRRSRRRSRRFPGINIDSNPNLARPSLEHIDVPTLVISARDDLFNTLPAAEFAAATIPNAKIVVYDTGGHLLVGRQLEVRAVISDFLAKQVH
jgi:2-hydroxy-6-oxonona-2,4-dienedioate hydrolase